jgi:hypothetical protein
MFRLRTLSFRRHNRPYARVTIFFFFFSSWYRKFFFRSYWETPKGIVWNPLVEDKSDVWELFMSTMTYQITMIWQGNSMCAASEPSRKTSEAADVEISYQINVIWWVMDGARRPICPKPRWFRLCPSEFPNNFSRQICWYVHKKNTA